MCLRSHRLFFAAAGLSILFSLPLAAQDPVDRDSWNVAEGSWGDEANWIDSEGFESAPPTVDSDRWAQIANGGTAIIEEETDTSGLSLTNGLIDIRNGGSLTIDLIDDPFSVGQGEIGPSGAIRLSGDASFKGLNVNSRGTIEMLGPSTGVETEGDFSQRGTLGITIGSDSTSSVNVGGVASLGGTLSPRFDGVSPAFGDRYEFLKADSVELGNVSVNLPSDVPTGRGLDYRVEADDTTASLVVGNLPILQVHRGTGAAKLLNVIGGPVTYTGYEIASERGLLNPDGFTGNGGDGWERPNPLQTHLTEISLRGENTVEVNDELDLGAAYNGGPTHPLDEDVTFRLSRPDGSMLHGLVEYVGPANDLVLNANPETGEVTIQNLSQFIDDVNVTGYNLLSPSGALLSDNWTSFEGSGAAGDGWTATPASEGSVAELNLSNSTVFNNGTQLSLGNIFNADGPRDLILEYTTVGSEEVLIATVEYQAGQEPEFLEADFNMDGIVDFTDFLTLSTQFNETVDPPGSPPDINGNGTVDFPDFLVLSTQFNMTSGAAAVPEPAGLSLIGLGGMLLLTRRRRRTEEPMRKSNPLFLVVAAILVCGQVQAQECDLDDCPEGELRVFQGEVVNITGPEDIVSLRQPNNILYAVNVWGDELERVVNGVTFWSDKEDVNPDLEGIEGYRTDWTHTVTNWQNKPEFGDSESDDELEEIMTDIRWTNNSPAPHPDPGVGSHFAVSENQRLFLELLISGGHDENRIWDIYVEGEPVVSEFDSTNYRDWDVGEVYAYRGEFVATDDEFNVTFNQLRRGGIDGNAILQAVILSEAGDPIVPGDFNKDGAVDLLDWGIMLENFHTAGATFEQGDNNFDRIVDLEDFLEFREIFNAANPAAGAAVPEPSSLGLLGMSGVLCLGLRRRRRRRTATQMTRGRGNTAAKLALPLFFFVVSLAVMTKPAQAQIDLLIGEINPITDPADIETIRDPANVVYAVNVWGEVKERVVNGVTFLSDRDSANPDGIPGYSTDFTHDVTNWQNKPEMGDTESHDELEEIMSDIRWTNNPAGDPVGVHFEVVENQAYTLELLISGNHEENRIWDIFLEDELAVDEFQSNNYEDYDQGTIWSFKHTFTALDDEYNVTFNQGETGADGNAILQAAILAIPGDTIIAGDFNGDEVVDINDFQVLVQNFRKEGAALSDGDINFDRVVDLQDFLRFRQIFNAPAGAAAVPEPRTWGLLSFGATIALCWRRRRR